MTLSMEGNQYESVKSKKTQKHNNLRTSVNDGINEINAWRGEA
jgi:hypothetical protein